jgi:hypothetical protein
VALVDIELAQMGSHLGVTGISWDVDTFTASIVESADRRWVYVACSGIAPTAGWVAFFEACEPEPVTEGATVEVEAMEIRMAGDWPDDPTPIAAFGFVEIGDAVVRKVVSRNPPAEVDLGDPAQTTA